MAMTYGDLHTFVLDHEHCVFRYWVYKRMFTPLEISEKFMDQSEFEDTTASFGLIRECIELGNGDFLLGLSPVYHESEDEVSKDVYYYRLSEIRLCRVASDQFGGGNE